MAVAVDFETFYARDYSVADAGIWHYVTEARFDAYLVAIAGEGIEFVGHPRDFDWGRLDGRVLVSHNSSFDGMVYARLVEQGVIERGAKFSEWPCTANLAAFSGGQRALSKAANGLLDLNLSKDMRGWMKGRTWEDAV
ncbi:hypothetical protein [Haloferula sp. A504]|uniref:hypothetical protein n=1 Tax=Haloferula sp. A504 TaxID=3373601 RepID=UPI0031C28606|nr:hypothetical protein [Verrucomicrobiaceae bacterium E54]